MKLTEKQRAVLLAVYHYANDSDRPAGEFDIWHTIKQRSLWPNGHVASQFHGHLRKLTERGLLQRHGSRGGYRWTLTAEGRSAIAWAA